MKIGLWTTVLLSLSAADAFTAPHEQPRQKSSALAAQKNDWMGPVAATAMGWALASQIAVAGMIPDTTITNQQQPLLSPSSSLIAVEQLDFSLPSYDSIGKSTGGFGEGTEARLGLSDSMVDPGSNEKAKQAEAMKKAEEARRARKKEAMQARVQRNEEQIRQAEMKKKADQQKLAELFGG